MMIFLGNIAQKIVLVGGAAIQKNRLSWIPVGRHVTDKKYYTRQMRIFRITVHTGTEWMIISYILYCLPKITIVWHK